MAALPPSNTARFYLTYLVADTEHTMTTRYDASAANLAVVEDQVDQFITAMDAKLYASSFVRAEVSPEGSNVRTAVVWGGQTEWGTGTTGPNQAPYFWSFTGKDVLGRRFRQELFGRIPTVGEDWRLFAIDDTSIEAALAVLETEEAVFLTIGGAGPVFNQYANRSVAQHWVDEQR